MKKLLTGLAFAALGCGPEGQAELVDELMNPLGAVAPSFTLQPKTLKQGVITNLNLLAADPNLRSTSAGPSIPGLYSCHHVQSAAKYNDLYILSHSMPDQAHLAVIDSTGFVQQVPLPPPENSLRNQVHAGGIQVMGDVLAVALADAPNCDADGDAPPPDDDPLTDDDPLPDVVRFYDISTPTFPRPGALPDLTLEDFNPDYQAQAVAATRFRASTVIAVLTSYLQLSFFTLADGAEEWTPAGEWLAAEELTPDEQKTCSSSELIWCRPDSINLYRDSSDRLKLLTFSHGTQDNPSDRERIGVYDVTLPIVEMSTPDPKRIYKFLPPTDSNGDLLDGNLRYGGGSEVTDDKTLMVFAFPKQAFDGNPISFARYGGWSTTSEYDSGRNATVALNETGLAVQVHKGTSGDKLYYRVGQADQNTRQVSWGESVQWTQGANPSVALDKDGNVIVLHTVYGEVTPDIYSCVGKVDLTTNTIDWPEPRCNVIGTGTNPTVAMNQDGGVIEVHNGSGEDNNRRQYARVGLLDPESQSVIFGEGESFSTGINSSVALNRAGTVVEAHNGTTATTEQNLYFVVGRVDFGQKTVTWGSASQHGTGTHPSIALNNKHRLVELHYESPESGEDGIYFSAGTPHPSQNNTITWNASVGGFRNSGTDAAVAISTGLLLETHNYPSESTDTALWYSLADVLRLP